MGASRFASAVAILMAAAASSLTAQAGQQTPPPPLNYLNQGPAWTPAARQNFYTQDQGSQMIPMAWLRAITTPDGKPFLFDQLQRYGYLPNPFATNGLPIGFTAAGPEGNQVAGMTCAACHTRNIEVNGTPYRVDGGPALSDFQAFLTDMVDGVGRVLASDAAFTPFAQTVLGGAPSQSDIDELKASVALWYLRENTLKQRAYGTPNMWGLGRLDAVSMIFNRLTGMDLGAPPSYLIPENIQPADAPVRYPFLWNAPKQDFTQWPGFASNGNNLLGLSRNLGEVYGVFGIYRPVKARWHLGGINFLSGNSANFEGLNALEEMIQKIGAPAWPWQVDPVLAAAGQKVWNKPSLNNQSCADCHAQKPGQFRSFSHGTWATPIVNVNTDTREWSILARTAKSGVLEGGQFLWFGKPIGKTDTSFGLLGFSVIGSIVQQYTTFASQAATDAKAKAATAKLPASLTELNGAFSQAVRNQAKPTNAYESRVLYGIWAAAPYLHNGSVPTLADLLKPSEARPASFKMGGNYDVGRVGLAADQPGNYVMTTTGCETISSGNSRCGHEFGTQFSDAEKTALLEYLKML